MLLSFIRLSFKTCVNAKVNQSLQLSERKLGVSLYASVHSQATNTPYCYPEGHQNDQQFQLFKRRKKNVARKNERRHLFKEHETEKK